MIVKFILSSFLQVCHKVLTVVAIGYKLCSSRDSFMGNLSKGTRATSHCAHSMSKALKWPKNKAQSHINNQTNINNLQLCQGAQLS